MIIDRYLIKETIISWLSVLLVLLLIFCSKHFVRYMSDAAAGELPTSMIIQLLSLFTLSYLVLIIPFAFYLAIVITLGRLYKENEITAAEACGIGIPRITKSIFYLSLTLAILVAGLSLWVAPWAEYKQYEIRNEAKSEAEFAFIAPGRFHEIRGGRGVFYVESIASGSGIMRNIFVQLQEQNRTDVFTAPAGSLRKNEATGDYFLVLKQGFRYEQLENGEHRRYKYAESGIRIYQSSRTLGTDKIIAQPTLKLFSMEGKESIAELQWRFSMPIACVMLGLIAVLLSRTGPREGRFGKLFVSLIVFIVYIYALMLNKNGVARGDIPIYLGTWWVHILAGFYIYYLARQQFGTLSVSARIKAIKAGVAV